jgi:hypothetical protein
MYVHMFNVLASVRFQNVFCSESRLERDACSLNSEAASRKFVSIYAVHSNLLGSVTELHPVKACAPPEIKSE